MSMATGQRGSGSQFCGPATLEELSQRIQRFLSSPAPSTKDVICRHAHLDVEEVRVKFSVPAAAEPGDASLEITGSVIFWPMVSDRMLASLPLDDVSSSMAGPTSFSVDQGVLSFIIDALTSTHLSVVTDCYQHISVSLNIDFLHSLILGHPFTVATQIFRVGERICFLGAEICQECGGDSLLCVRADHTKAFYTSKTQRRHKQLPMSRL